MGKLIKTDCKYPLAEVVSNIDSEKFWIPITEEILKKMDGTVKRMKIKFIGFQ